jgi:tetratricopeptide (TPR) repeat protein
MKNLSLLFLFILLTCSVTWAQAQRDPQLAAQYLQNSEYDKAVVIYEKLYDRQPVLYYSQYLQCLLALKDFNRAEKIVKRQAKASGNSPVFFVDYGYVFKLAGQSDKAKQQYERALREMSPDQQQISAVANAFVSRDELDYAIEAYQKGRKLMRGIYSFNFELADLYNRKQEIGKMLEEYMEILLVNESYLQNIQNILQTNLANDPTGSKNEFVKNLLLKRIQEYPDRMVFSELLTWLFLQQKDFESVFIHSRAMDKRLKENGARLMYLADICLANENYDVPVKCYEYVISKGSNNPNYIPARIGLLNASNKKITRTLDYTREDLLNLEKDYLLTLKELGKNASSASLIKGLAHLQGFYLGKVDEAILSLELVINMPGVTPQFRAECKIELGDILLFKGEIWESTLLYSQVDLDFKNTPIGEEAKYKNAVLSYYNGDFGWAQGQLDVLKSGTSHLIANDAMALSLLITENIDPVDSNTVPLLMYARAELLCYQNRYDQALLTLDSVKQQFPAHSLADELLFKKAQIMKRKGKYTEAALFFQQAELYEKKLANTAKAMELYKLLMEKYPSSLYVSDARKRYRVLRGENIN